MDRETYQQLLALLGNQTLVERWWRGPNRAFDMRSPEDVWNQNSQGPERVRKYIAQFLYGDYF
jgi:uncharacterized protein (DUF2384 family)